MPFTLSQNAPKVSLLSASFDHDGHGAASAFTIPVSRRKGLMKLERNHIETNISRFVNAEKDIDAGAVSMEKFTPGMIDIRRLLHIQFKDP